ncbi:MAG: Uma2 family endonuclease [Chloroflexi bacterium]|nr:Uma2 family endonuclease [Chloroflexota bacterium]
MTLTGRRLTLDEFLALPEESPALEFIDGVVVPKVSPKMYHGRIQSKFVERVNVYAEPRELAVAFSETRATFGGQSRIPDVGVYRWSRVPQDTDGKVVTDSFVPWDIAVEIVSPDQSRSDVADKCQWYCANGVEISLMIDPIREDVLRFGADGSRIVVRGDDVIDLESVIPGFRITPYELFSALYFGRR